MTLPELFQIIMDRKNNPTDGSYTARLLAAGEDAVLKKIGEEAMEVILAAKGQGQERLVEEIADLVYHTLVLLVHQEISFAEVESELARRHPGKISP